MMHVGNSNLQEAFHRMEFFLQDLHRAVIQQEIFNFHKIPQLYTTLYPAAAARSSRGSDRTKKDEANTSNQNGGGFGGGLGALNKGGHDLWNSCSTGGDSQHTNSDNPHKDKGIFICEKCRILNPIRDRMERPIHQK